MNQVFFFDNTLVKVIIAKQTNFQLSFSVQEVCVESGQECAAETCEPSRFGTISKSKQILEATQVDRQINTVCVVSNETLKICFPNPY